MLFVFRGLVEKGVFLVGKLVPDSKWQRRLPCVQFGLYGLVELLMEGLDAGAVRVVLNLVLVVPLVPHNL